MIATRRTSRRHRRCINPYPCGGQIRPGETYWALALPPHTEPLYADRWTHAAECAPCYEQRRGLPLDMDPLA